MSYVSKGEDAGKIQLSLQVLGVRREDWESLEKIISRFKNVTRATASTEGWLTVSTNLASFKSADDLAKVLEEMQGRIIRSCKAKIKAYA